MKKDHVKVVVPKGVVIVVPSGAESRRDEESVVELHVDTRGALVRRGVPLR